jgi:tetratricopeptide (TPR) repeat protein
MQGNLAPGVVPSLLREVYADSKTGALRFARGEEQCALRFVRGHIFRAAASAKRLHMGEIMVARGMLSQDALDRATEVVCRDRRVLGQVLKASGAIDQEVLEDALVVHVIEVLAEVFSWRDGIYYFEEREPETFLEETDYPLKLSTGAMILEAVALVQNRDAVRFALGNMDCVLRPCTNARLRFQRVDLAPIDGFVLSRIDGALSAREVIAVTPLPEDAVERSLFALLCTGIVEPAPEAQRTPMPASVRVVRQEILDAYDRLSTQNHFETLGISRSATDDDVKTAYHRLARRMHPDIHHDPALADLREQIEALFARLNVAYEVLSRQPSRAAYERALFPDSPTPLPKAAPPAQAPPVPQPAPAPEPAAPAPVPPRAEDIFMRAKECYEEGRTWEAVALLSETIRFAERGLRARARVLLGLAYLKNPERARDAEKELLAALADDPGNVDACLALGGVYRNAGLSARAKGMFQKVLELKPGHRKAQAELDALTGESQDTGKKARRTARGKA